MDADLFTLNGRWVPLYNLHKTFAGLLDAYTYAASGRALAIATALADWWLGISSHIPDHIFEEILRTEFGGMNDAFAILAGITGRADHWAEARRFSHLALLAPLAEGRDELDGLHANTQIPKVVGYARLAAATGETPFAKAADSFWNTVVSRRTVSIGGNSVREHFHPSADFSPMIQDAQGPETCNTYNMLKLARLRFERTGDPAAIDFYERASYNHILSSQHPRRGGFVYFTPMRPAHYRVYSRAQESMWCCVGSGLENHARYGELIYSHDGDALSVNLYAASELAWAERGLTVRLETAFPRSGVATLRITAATPTEATIRLRRPVWSPGMEVDVDGSPVDVGAAASASDGGTSGSAYVSVRRLWEGTTVVTVRLEMELRAELLPDGSPWVSFLYGPVVLAARAGDDGVGSFEAPDERMGHVASGTLLPLAGTPVVAGPEPLDAVVLRDRSAIIAELTAVDADGGARTVLLEPFAGIHDERYTVYWPTGPAAGAPRGASGTGRCSRRAGRNHRRRGGRGTAARGRPCLHRRVHPGRRPGGNPLAQRNGLVLLHPVGSRRPATLLRVRFRAVEGRGHDLRLNGSALADPVRSARDGDEVVTDFAIPDQLRNHDGGRLVFAVHAKPDCTTGDLLSVQLLKTG